MVSVRYKGLTIDVDETESGTPLIFIYTGGNYTDDDGQPAIEVYVDGALADVDIG